VFNARTNPAPFAGRYTAIFPGATNRNSHMPHGNGYATIVVNLSGSIVSSSALADGTKVSQGGYVTQSGQWPFYAALYRGRGHVLGWLGFSSASDQPPLSGQTSWIKSSGAAGSYYADGFQFLVSTTGASYQPPSRGLPVLDMSNGYISFSSITPGASFTNDVTVGKNNRIVNLSDNKLAITLTPGSGLFRGTVVSPDGGRPIPFGGVILQIQNAGSGYFLLGSQSGRVDLGGY
jgi:hypothetical protein